MRDGGRQPWLPWIGGAAMLLATTCGPAEIRAPGAPLILISIDTLRSDHLPSYGYRGVETPHMDRLAADSVLFERAYSPCPLTLPSHASIFTGLLPTQHGVRDNKGFQLAEPHETLAERLGHAGYRSLGAVSSMVLRAGTGLAQGFDAYDDAMKEPPGRRSRVIAQRRGAVAIQTAVKGLEELSGEHPFFLFVHLFDPHTPYDAPEPFASRYSAYDAEIAYADAQVGALLAELDRRGLYDPALIVLLSDHGEGLGDHVEKEHGLSLYREALQVPLMFKLPRGARAGERVKVPVALVDVLPTILAILEIEHGELAGRALLDPAPPRETRSIYSETFFPRYQYGWSELRSILLGDLHYIHAPRAEMFDVVEDPAERDNLLRDRDVPRAVLEELARLGPGEESTAAVSEEELRQLASLGYVGNAATPEVGELPDPKDYIAGLEELWSVIHLDVEELPDVARLHELLAQVVGGRESFHRPVARSLLTRGRLADAAEILHPFAESSDPDTRILLGQIATTVERFDQAHRHFDRALELDPEHPRAQLGKGTLLLSEGRWEPASLWLQRAVELDPGLADAWNGLGVVRARGGDEAGAVQAWRRAVELDPELADAWFNLALGHRRLGDVPAAADALRRYVGLVEGEERERAQEMLRSLGGAGGGL